MDIYNMASKVKNQSDFVAFIKALLKNLQENPTEWENIDLKNFLTGIEGYCFDKQEEELKWNTFAEILLAARVYE